MLRGTLVTVNDKANPKHLAGKRGIALERIKSSGYIRVLQRYQGYLTELCYPEDNLDILEPPMEL